MSLGLTKAILIKRFLSDRSGSHIFSWNKEGGVFELLFSK
jgi:hypothetical protein